MAGDKWYWRQAVKASSARKRRAVYIILICLPPSPPTRRISGFLFLPRNQTKNHPWRVAVCLAGDKWFEHPNDGVRVRCLTAWRRPNVFRWLVSQPYLRYSIKNFRFLQAFLGWFWKILKKFFLLRISTFCAYAKKMFKCLTYLSNFIIIV